MQLPTSLRRRRPAVLAAGVAGSLALAMSTTGTLSAFTAQIQNSANTAATGYLAMQETLLDGSMNPTGTACSSNDGTSASVSTNSSTCSTINKYGATALKPGGAVNTTNISIKNTGTIPATAFTLTPGACSQSGVTGVPNGSATDLCSKINITVKSGSTVLYQGTAAAFPNVNPNPIDIFKALGISSLAAGASLPFTITAGLDASAGNTYTGLQVSQALTWNFTA